MKKYKCNKCGTPCVLMFESSVSPVEYCPFNPNTEPIWQEKPIKKLNWKKAKAEIEEYHDKYCNSEAAHRTFNKIQEIINNNITEE